MKLALGELGKATDSGQVAMIEVVEEFICFVTSEATEICKKDNRKTITPEDIIHALEALNFERFSENLKLFIQKYRSFVK
jgi:nuclear transcription Y subunit beta